MCIQISFLYIALSRFFNLFYFTNRYHINTSQFSSTKEEKIALVDMPTPILQIFAGGSDPYDTLELDYESKKYIKIRLNNIFVSYDLNGNEEHKSKYYDLTPCSNNFINNTQFQYSSNQHQFIYCSRDPQIYLSGTQDDQFE